MNEIVISFVTNVQRVRNLDKEISLKCSDFKVIKLVNDQLLNSIFASDVARKY